MSTIKLTRAKKISKTGPFPRTFDSIIARIPQAVITALSSRQLAAMIDAMAAQYEDGHSAGYADTK